MHALARWVLPWMLLFLLAAPRPLRAEGELRLADLGDFRLESGRVIEECHVGYRTFGTLDPGRSNVILFPTWFSGTSQDLVDLGFIGPGKLADTSRWFVVAVDALGNGVSSSPSNSRKQPGRAFPAFTVRDLVRAQHQVLTRYLGLERLHAVIGISMGGMQAFQWTTFRPGFAQRAVSIMGTPRASPADVALYDAGLRALDAAGAVRDGETPGPETLAVLLALLALTPEYDLQQLARLDGAGAMARVREILAHHNLTDWARQLGAMIGHDIYRGSAASEGAAAGAIRAKLFVVVSRYDLLVDPRPALALAGALKAPTLVLEGEGGHFSVLGEREAVAKAVSAFLSRRD